MKQHPSTLVPIAFSIAVGLAIPAASGQQDVPVGAGTRADYERAARLPGEVRGKVRNDSLAITWSADGSSLWFRMQTGPRTGRWVRVDRTTGEAAPLFDHDRIAEELGTALGDALDADALPIEDLAESAPGRLSFRARTGLFELTAEGRLTRTGDAGPGADKGRGRGRRSWRSSNYGDGSRPSRRSPDGRFDALERDGNLFLRDVASDSETALTDDATDGRRYEGRTYWSPTSSHFVAMDFTPGDGRKVTIVDSRPDDQLQPKTLDYDYDKPGDRIDVRKPHLFDAASGREIPLDDALFGDPWSIRSLRWEADGGRFTFVFDQRGHAVQRLLAVDAATGTVSVLAEEDPGTFVDYAHKTYLHWLPERGEFLWASERDGWNHLYRCDAASGEVLENLTPGDWVVRGIDEVDDGRGIVWLRTVGVDPAQDPYHVHHARIDLGRDDQPSRLTHLTTSDGTHTVQWAPDKRHLVATWSRADHPPVHELRSAESGALVATLAEADWSELLAMEPTWHIPERFVAAGRDGTTPIWGLIYRPSHFDPERSYPVVEDIYAGPHDHHVPKSFHAYARGRSLAELGFVVVRIDGMGTNWRSKSFHDVAWQNLGDSGFPDRIAWMKAAAVERPWMDLSRVGVYGGSAGGQSAVRALIAHGDFYKVAAADCGCHDNRMDKVWWNELWMGYPVGPHYEEQSNVTQAHRLQGDLFLTVGELDRNVDPASTLQLVDALIAADKDFEFLMFPGGGHGAGESRYGVRRRRDFFVRKLLGVEPRSR